MRLREVRGMNARPLLLPLCLWATTLCGALAPIDPVAPVTDIEELGVVAAGFAEKGGPDRYFADGAVAANDDDSGATVNPSTRHRDREGCFMHSPYRRAHGVVFQEFTFRLPEAPAATIEGATAMYEDSERSDGVTFRVLVNGKEAWAEHRKSRDWQTFRADLAAWRGQTVTVRFEQSPGPKDNTGWDGALWGERKLLLPGLAVAVRPAPPPLDLSRLSARENKSWVPLSGFEGNTGTALSGDIATLAYRGDDGELVYTWDTAGLDPAHPFGSFTLRAQMAGDQPVELPLGHRARIEWTNAVTLASRHVVRSARSIKVEYRYTNAAGEKATLGLKARIEEKSLVLEAQCDQPWIASLNLGEWGPVAVRRRLPMPYYGHTIDYLPGPNLFVSAFPDWTASGASRFQKNIAIYAALTDGSRLPMGERFIFTAAWHLNETFANIPNPPSPWRKDMGRRIVLDIWNGRSFDDSAAGLADVAAFGVVNDFIIFHIWQRDGYDHGLPAHWPAREQQGGEPAMQRLSAKARELGHLFSLHENYVDYYPNYEHFTTNDLSLDSTGGIQKAWFNEGTGIQSFAIKPSSMGRLSREQSPAIHKRYGTTAAYLDVHSCVPLWFHVDQQAGLPGAGRLQSVWAAHRELWQFGRDAHRGPMTGEGNGHWPWSGWLDGVEAQFGTGWPWGEGPGAPLLVDFNLLRIHPLQINHGQGYYDRWFGKSPPWEGGIPMCALDEYRMQEVAFGHTGFLGYDMWRKPGIAWLEKHLMTAVSSRHATESVRDIRYFLDGAWVDATAAAKTPPGPGASRAAPFHRVRIDYANGLSIVANAAAADLDFEGFVLPQFGWLARQGRDFSAGTIRRDGVVVDFVDAPDLQLANARRSRDWDIGAPRPVRPSVREFQAMENRRIRISYDWKTGCALTNDWKCFVHFCQPDGSSDGWKIVAQQDHNLRPPATAWTNGGQYVDGPYDFRFSEKVADGRYAWFVGLWDGNSRMEMDGPNGGRGRIRMGDLVIEQGGAAMRFEPAAEKGSSRAEWFRRNLNTAEKTIDFGFVKTDGAVMRKREGRAWKQITYPATGVTAEWAAK